MEKEFISEQEAVALLRYGRVYMPDGAFRYAVGPYPVAGTDMWVVGEYEQQLLCVTSAVALRLLRGSRVCLLFHRVMGWLRGCLRGVGSLFR
ncbi:MAG: hypothetical protein IJN23_03655 [Akkermansia sp.]|nr:hypothetical protein [Akkermansia sp.]